MAERETGERRERRGTSPQLPLGFRSLRSISSLALCSQSTEEVKIRLRALLVVRNKAAKSHKKLAARDEGQL